MANNNRTRSITHTCETYQPKCQDCVAVRKRKDYEYFMLVQDIIDGTTGNGDILLEQQSDGCYHTKIGMAE